MIFYGVLLVQRGELSVGKLLAVYALSAQLYNPIVRLTQAHGMLAATLIGIFLVPVLFVAVERLTRRKEQAHTPPRTVRAIAEGVAD